MKRAEKAILTLLDRGDLAPTEIFDALGADFDEITLRRALLDLVTRQAATWRPGRRLSRRRQASLVHA